MRPARRHRAFSVAGCLLICLLSDTHAYAAASPTAGGQIQQLPHEPERSKTIPSPIQLEQSRATIPPLSTQTSIRVTALHITGQTVYTQAELRGVTGFIAGKKLTLTGLRAMATKIADHYHKNGYIVAEAYLAAQEIKNGVVTITVIEGHYGAITLNNQTNLSDTLADKIVDDLNNGAVISYPPLERRLLLLSDLPGVVVKSTLTPGVSLGVSDLIVDLTPGRQVTGSVDADNAGNRYTGEYRIGATVNFNEPLGVGDVATLRVLTSGYGLYYLRGSYQLQLGCAKVGAAYSLLGYRLGKEFEELHANGTSRIATLFGSYPLIRSRTNNLSVSLTSDYKTFQDRVDATSTVTDKQAQVVSATLHGDMHDNFGGGGNSEFSLGWSSGNINIQTPAARSADAITAQSNGLYNKLGYSVSRLQNVTERLSLYAAINGQLALKNLDVSEKMELGGMYAVRAYPEGEGYADEGYVMNLEARFLLPRLSEQMSGHMQLVGFIDSGAITVNKTPWTTEPNHRALYGAGGGFTWMDNNNFSLKSYYAFTLGNEPATSGPDISSGRFWIQIVKYL